MKRHALRLVADNTVVRPVTPEARGAAHARAAWAWVRYGFGFLVAAMMLPLQLVGRGGRFGVRLGAAVVRGIVRVGLGIVGWGVLLFVLYGLARVIFYPWLH